MIGESVSRDGGMMDEYAGFDTTSGAWVAGVAMGERHALTGDPYDQSDARCEPLERERDSEAARLDPRAPFGSPTFHAGYEYGYRRALGEVT